MKKNALLVAVVVLLTVTCAQAQLQASNWYFGFNAGINFDPVTGAVTALTDGQVSTNEGCATISDAAGNLLFYTDGSFVYDASHAIMQNGTGLLGNPSSTQSAIIIPKPQDINIYYIFTVDTTVGGGDRGLHYYEVDMTLNGGLGAVTTNIATPNNLIPTCSEKITAINHAVNDEILVTALASQSGTSTNFDTYYTFTVSAAGINTTPVQSVVPSVANGGGRRGNLKFSADGQYMVSCNMGSGTYLYDFDQFTGVVSNERQLLMPTVNDSGYGVEFSPDGSLLYIAASNDAGGAVASNHTSTLWQFDLNDPNIGSSGLDVDTRIGYRSTLQLGIDGKIYRALSDSYDVGRPFLGVINNPDVRGAGSNYAHDAIPLAGRVSTQGLPPFIQSFFALIEAENTCLGNTTTFSFSSDNVPSSILWEFGDGTTSSMETPDHIYASAGIYNVVLTLTINGLTRTYRKNVQIYDIPVANPINDIDLCDTGNDGNELVDLTTIANPQIYDMQDTMIFSVQYYLSQNDADLDQNEITLPYDTSLGTTTVYARIYNSNNTECFETTIFDINLFEQPVANPVLDLEACDDDFDGRIDFNLAAQDASTLGNQSAATFTVTYHSSQVDADNDTAALSNTYTNVTAFNETIFIRIENTANPDCVDTTQSFDLIVNPKPVANNLTIFQCDEDGTPDGLTTFNLSQYDTTVANSAAGVTVTYYENQNNADAATAAIDNMDYSNTTAMQDIIARVTNDVTGCFTTSTITLSVSASDAQDTSLELCDDDGNEDGLQTFTLSNADGDVLTAAPANVTVAYYATINDALTELNALPNNYTTTIANTQTIYARAESPDGNCFGISEVELIVNPLPVIELTDLVDYCGNNPQPLTINAGNLSPNAAAYTYLWSTGETTYSIEVTTGGDYTVQIADGNTCSRTRTVTVIISDEATINNIDITHAGTGDAGSIIVDASGLGDYEYRISLEDDFQDSPVFENIEPGFYTLYVRDKNGCGTVTADFSIVGYPRFFTPNNDGFNDFWQLEGVSVVFEPNTVIYLFDRFGKLIKQVSPQSVGWDGTYNGTPMPSSDYWFEATLMDGTTFRSHFTLKR